MERQWWKFCMLMAWWCWQCLLCDGFSIHNNNNRVKLSKIASKWSNFNLAAKSKGFGGAADGAEASSSSSKATSSSSSASSKGGGFGSGSSSSGKTQVKTIDATSSCPCGSGNTYGACCQSLHSSGQGLSRYPDPELVTRARYTAFAVGMPSYLIDSTHPTQKDHARHAESNIDGRKARKAWEKELVSKNSEVFEFLKLEIIPREEVDLVANNVTVLAGQETVSYRILVRKRDDRNLITYQETAIYVPRPADHVPLGGEKSAASSKNKDPTASNGWLYSHGVVSPVSEAVSKRLMADAPKYQPDATIRDKWSDKPTSLDALNKS